MLFRRKTEKNEVNRQRDYDFPVGNAPIITSHPAPRLSQAPVESRPTAAGSRESHSTNRPEKLHTTPTSRPRRLRITKVVLREIERTVGSFPAETGGVLGGNLETGLISHFYYDVTARQTGSEYSPDHVTLNQLLKGDWNPRDIRLLGFVHSHPPGVTKPSAGDLRYARVLLDGLTELDRLELPIVMTKPDTGAFELFPYGARRGQEGAVSSALALEVVETVAPASRPSLTVHDLRPNAVKVGAHTGPVAQAVRRGRQWAWHARHALSTLRRATRHRGGRQPRRHRGHRRQRPTSPGR